MTRKIVILFVILCIVGFFGLVFYSSMTYTTEESPSAEYKDITGADIKKVITAMSAPCARQDTISYVYNYYLKKSYTPRMPNMYGMYYWETVKDKCANIKDYPDLKLLTSADRYVLKHDADNMVLLNLFDVSSAYCPQIQQLASAHEAVQSYYGAIFWYYKAYNLCKDEALLQKVHALHDAAGLTYNKELLDSFIDVQKKPA